MSRGEITIEVNTVTVVSEAMRETSTTTVITAEAPLDVNSFNVINQSFANMQGETPVTVGVTPSGGLKIRMLS